MDNPSLNIDLDRMVAQELAKPQAEISAPAPERKRGSHWAQLAIVLGHIADTGSTIWALKQGAVEMNPLYGPRPSMGRLLSIKTGGAIGQMLIQHRVGKLSPTTANVLGFGAGAGLGAVTANNIYQGNKIKGQK